VHRPLLLEQLHPRNGVPAALCVARDLPPDLLEQGLHDPPFQDHDLLMKPRITKLSTLHADRLRAAPP
jgi:hypothetical protein